MKAFVFAPTNEFKGKFTVTTEDTLPQDLQDFLVNNAVSPYDYIECTGKTWTIVKGSDGLELAEGRIHPGRTSPIEPTDIPISTSAFLPGFNISHTTGIVFGEAIMGANVLRDIAGSFTDFFGGRSGAYESKLRQGRAIAIQEMMEEANRQGANAVVGVRIDYETIGSGASMLMICASGTAVTAESTNGESGPRD
jgi:uncharacterized protein YbjQ (UPF0145 family)